MPMKSKGWWALPLCLALYLYWPTLRLPLIYDTLLHIRIAKELTLASVWLPTEAFGFYRPLTFLPFLLIKPLFGYYPAWLLHGLNVGQHALNALLLTWLSWRLWRNQRWAVLSGLLLAAFPFSYQAVAVYGHNVHPTTTNLLLLGLHAFLSALAAARTSRRWLWWGLTLLLFALGVLSHESGLLFGPLAALVAWQTDTGRRRWLKLPATVYGLTAAGILYAVAYQFLPITRAPQATAGMADNLSFKALYLLQALAHPFTWFAHVWPRLPAAGIILGSVAATLLLAAWATRQPANRFPLLLGGGWWLLASLLIAVPLPADYLLHGPRLLYVSSVGLALLWPALLFPRGLKKGARLGELVGAAAILFILISGSLFVRSRVDAYVKLTSPLVAARAALAEAGEDEAVLWVNLPAWIAPPRNTYPLGAEFVSMLGPYLFVEELTEENGLGRRPTWAVALPDLLTQTGYGYGVHEQTPFAQVAGQWGTGTRVIISRYDNAGAVAQVAGRIQPRQNTPPLARLGPYELAAATTHQCEGRIEAMLTWRQSGEEGIPATTSLFVQALDASGQLIAQADGPPLGLRPDLLSLGLDWEAAEVRQFSAPSAAALLVGAYDYGGGQRYPAYTAAGAPLPDNALRLPLLPCAAAAP